MQLSKLFSLELRFLVIGGWNTFVGFLVYTLLVSSIAKNHYLLALIFSSLIAGTHAYFTQRVFVWKSQGGAIGQFFRFGLVLLAQFTANFLLLYLAVDVFELDALPSQYAIGMLIIVFTYFAHKNWTFNHDSRDGAR
jgi:predicted ribosomally synthesized peptide with SipW-like signal peptide